MIFTLYDMLSTLEILFLAFLTKEIRITHGRIDGPTDRRTDRRTDTSFYRDAMTNLKTTCSFEFA